VRTKALSSSEPDPAEREPEKTKDWTLSGEPGKGVTFTSLDERLSLTGSTAARRLTRAGVQARFIWIATSKPRLRSFAAPDSGPAPHTAGQFTATVVPRSPMAPTISTSRDCRLCATNFEVNRSTA
jgi:hypothetical protein